MALRFGVSGAVREQTTGRPLPDLVVRAHDRDLRSTEALGEATTDGDGRYRIEFDPDAQPSTSERPPGLLLTLHDAASGDLVHLAPDVVAWGDRRRTVVDIEVPRTQRDGGDDGLVLVDGHGAPVRTCEAAQSLLVTAGRLEPDAHHVVRVVGDDGDEVLRATLLSDRFGRIAPTVLWPDVGIGDPERGGPLSFADPDEATAALAGRRFEVELSRDGRTVGTSTFTMAEERTRPRLLPTDGDGRLLRGALVGRDDVHVTGTNLPPGSLVDVYLVASQLDWRVGDAFLPAVGLDGQEAVARVEIDAEATSFRIPIWKATQAVPGSYDVIARVVIPHEWRAGDRLLRRTDLVSERLLTTLVIRKDIFEHKAVQLGCVMTQPIAGQLVSGAPYFRFAENFPRGTDVWAALDPAGLMPAAVGRKVRFSVMPHKDAAGWAATPTFTEVASTGAEVVTTSGCINGNRALVWSNPQQPGQYDLVVDFGNNEPNPGAFVADGSFDPPLDMIDGYFTVGFHVTDDPSVTGPHLVGSTSYDEAPVTIGAAGTWYPDGGGVVGNTPSGTLDLPRRAIVRYPADSAGVGTPVSSASPSYPVVLISPGQGLLHTGYAYLCDHLASHGFVAVALDATELNYSISGGGSFDSRANGALAHLALLRTLHQNPGLLQGKLDLSRILVMGHSRGGDGALATAVFNQSLGLGWGIKAVLALAPTDWSGTGPTPLVMPQAVPYLCIHGSADRDVGTVFGAPFSTGFNGLGFRAYDRSNGEKAMVLVRDATHNLFNADSSSEINEVGATSLTRTQHETLLRGYATAFAQWHLQGRAEQRAYFTGELRIPAAAALEVHNQYRPRASDAKTLDNFQSMPSVATNSLGGSVTTAALAVPAVEGAARGLDRNAPHQTRALLLRWGSAAARYESNLPATGGRDVSGYGHLSFRVAQTYGYCGYLGDQYHTPNPGLVSAELGAGFISTHVRDELSNRDMVALGPGAVVSTIVPGWRWRIVDAGTAYVVDKEPRIYTGQVPPLHYDIILIRREGAKANPTGQPQDLYVRLATAGGGPARSIRAGSFGAIPFPMQPTTYLEQPQWDEERTLAALKTIRIPLDAWTIKCMSAPIVDLTDLASVTFELSATGSGELLIDDIEFTP